MIDKAKLAQKYAEERAKRIRPEGRQQYVSVDLSSPFEVDPFVKERIERDPVRCETEVVVIGGGWAGVLAAAGLRREGIDDFRIVERGGDFGGTWYWNRYPGIACDVESYIYLPWLEELGYMPSMRYAPGDEIMDYSHLIARRYQLYENALLQTIVTDLTWDEERCRWNVDTDRGDKISARYVLIGTGGLHRPKLPGIAGIDTFEGAMFHSSRWDFEVTGGNTRGGLDKLSSKRVAIIGTGPSALQAIPHLAQSGAEVHIFQRTPIAVARRDNSLTDESWFRSLEPGWQQRRMENFNALTTGIPVEEKLVEDAWTEIWYIPPFEEPADGSEPDFETYMKLVEDYDIEQMESMRARVDSLVDDERTAESLKPWYGVHCKRPSFHDEYLQSFNLPNVHLIDTNGRGPDEITAKGVVFDGTEYEVDVLILATGFEATVPVDRSGGFDIVGVDGRTLREAFTPRVRTVHGIHVHGFPNFFLIGGARGAAGSVNVLYVTTMQAAHVARNVRQLIEAGVVREEITEEAVQAWCDEIDALMGRWFNPEATAKCTPSYFNNEGVFDLEGKLGRPIFADLYGGGPLMYKELLAKWNESEEYMDKADIVTASEYMPAHRVKCD